MVFVFDLDDTLYRELDFVHGGFEAVARHLAGRYGAPVDAILARMEATLAREGRGAVFDDLLRHLGRYSRRAVRECLSVYRAATPRLALHDDARACLERLASWPRYVVTDGHKGVQHNKLSALGLYQTMRFCYVTHRYGRRHAKPSPYCFEKIREREGVEPSEVVYVGDNPHKDFVGIRPRGFVTVRVLRGPYAGVAAAPGHDAHVSIADLGALTASGVAGIPWDDLRGAARG